MLAVHEPGDRVDPGHLERRVGLQRREDPRQPAREHRLSRPGRPAEKDVVSARSGELEGAARAFLAANVGEVGCRRRAVAVRRRQRRLGLQLTLTAKIRDGLGEVPDRDRGDTGERSLPRGVGRTEETLGAQPPGALCNGENAAYPTQAAVQRELSDRCGAFERAAWHLL